jgi:hypothetical protein
MTSIRQKGSDSVRLTRVKRKIKKIYPQAMKKKITPVTRRSEGMRGVFRLTSREGGGSNFFFDSDSKYTSKIFGNI